MFAYTLSTKANDTSKEFTYDSSSVHPEGIWSDGRYMWLSNSSHNDEGLVAYVLVPENMETLGARVTGEDLDLSGIEDNENGQLNDIFVDGDDVLWVLDFPGGGHIFAYDFSEGTRMPEKDLFLDPANGKAVGMWVDDTHIYVADTDDKKVYAYRKPGADVLQACLWIRAR